MSAKVYECALTGVTEEAADKFAADGLDDLPVGWTKITMTRRQVNTKWLAIQQVKDATVEALLQQFPEEIREVQRFVVEIQVEAQLKALENDTPMFVSDVEDVIYVSDSEEALEALDELRAQLGLEEMPEVEDDDDDEDEDEEDDEEEEEE
jgi:hypothetical protein